MGAASRPVRRSEGHGRDHAVGPAAQELLLGREVNNWLIDGAGARRPRDSRRAWRAKFSKRLFSAVLQSTGRNPRKWEKQRNRCCLNFAKRRPPRKECRNACQRRSWLGSPKRSR